MRRELIFNWNEEHTNVKLETERDKPDPLSTGDIGKGWTYLTFFGPGTIPSDVLFDVDRLENTALENGYYLPRNLVYQHNKVVVTAYSQVGNSPSIALYALVEFLREYARQFNHPKEFPELGFYGKVGGIYDRPEKGRVLAIYAPVEESLLAIDEIITKFLPRLKIPYASFDHRLANGLSDIPRLLDGLDDPVYQHTGATHYRITDPRRFEQVLDQARHDYSNYIFE
jgi:hypothetical protein